MSVSMSLHIVGVSCSCCIQCINECSSSLTLSSPAQMWNPYVKRWLGCKLLCVHTKIKWWKRTVYAERTNSTERFKMIDCSLYCLSAPKYYTVFNIPNAKTIYYSRRSQNSGNRFALVWFPLFIPVLDYVCFTFVLECTQGKLDFLLKRNVLREFSAAISLLS